MKKKPNVVVAIVFGLLAPGAVLFYAGWPRIALVVMVAFVAALVGLPWLAVNDGIDPARLPTLLAISALLITGAAAGAGAVAAVRAQPAERPAYLHAWWVLGAVVLLWLLTSQLRSRYVIPHLVSFAAAGDDVATSEVRRGALVVVKRKYAPAEVAPGALVLVAQPGGVEKLTRVASTDSGTVLADGSKVSPADVLGVGVVAR